MKLLIHIPKNAGLSLRKLKGDIRLVGPSDLPSVYRENVSRYHRKSPNWMHARWIDLTDQAKKIPNIAVVRNPWSRMVSRFTYGKKLGIVSCSFEAFLERRWEKVDPYNHHRAVSGWASQIEYIADGFGEIKVPVVIRQEYLQSDISAVLGKKVTLEQANVSATGGDYRSYYTDDTAQAVADWYVDDINHWGFDFDSPAKKNVFCS